jgi:serine/threonine-protein kinase
MSDERRVAELLAVWEQRRQSGRDVTAAELCRDCPHLLDTLTREIAGRESAGPPAAAAPTDGPEATAADRLPPTEAFALARYRPFRFHARGGLGEVFVARDAELGRDVALKRIRPAKAHQDDLRERFRREAEITGRLEHPGVVPVYGLGQDSAGQPYYAMRFVEGETLADAIDTFYKADAKGRDPGERSLAFRQLLERFQAVCQALAYAHNRGILHRDVKPANVMLGRYGETLVVDWGLARQFQRTEVEKSSGEETLAPDSGGDATHLGAALGTPAYMSPEQAAGMWDELGPASDVYGLGATLYNLLTGRVPFEGRHVRETLQKVQRGDFPPPRKVRPDVPPALEAICLKAMALEPARRYASSLDLAGDVSRWLADEPVTAYREPRVARAWRWVRQHRGGVTAAVAVLAVTAVFSVLSAVVLTAANERERRATALAVENEQEACRLKDEAERQRDEAKKQRDKAAHNYKLAREAVDRFFTQISENTLLNKAGLQPLRKQLLQTALEFYQRFVKERADDPDPDLQAELGSTLYRLAGLTSEIESAPKAVPLYQQSAAIFDALAASQPDNAYFRSSAAWSYNDLGIVLRDIDTAAALRAHEAARTRFAVLVREHPDDPQHLSDWGASLNNIGTILYDLGRLQEAEQHFRDSIVPQRRAVALKPDVGTYRKFLSNHYSSLGDTLKKRGRPAEALAAQRDAREIRVALTRDFPDNPDFQSLLASSDGNISSLMDDLGDRAGAIRALEAGRSLQEQLARANPDVIDYESSLATSDVDLGDLYRRVGQPEKAEASLTRAVAAFERLSDKHRQGQTYLNNVAWARSILGLLHRDLGRHDRAEAEYRLALEVRERMARDFPDLPLYQSNLAYSFSNLAGVHRSQGRTDDAEAEYWRAQAIRERLVRGHPDNPTYRADLAQTHHDLGLLFADRRQRDRAEPEYRTALALRIAVVHDHPGQLGHWFDLAWTCNNLGGVYYNQRQQTRAAAAHFAALTIRAGLAWRKPDNTEYLSVLGLSLSNLADSFNDANLPAVTAGLNTLSIRLQETVLGRAPADEDARRYLSEAHWGRAQSREKLGRDADAVADWQRAVEFANAASRPYLRAQLAGALSRIGRHAEAAAEAEKAVREPNTPGLILYDAACILALASAAVDQSKDQDAAERERLRDQRAARAVELLRKAQSVGFFKESAVVAHMKSDSDLDALRSREDFRRFLASLDQPARP